MSLPKYVMRLDFKSYTTYRYNPPQDAVDAGVVKREALGRDWRKAYTRAKELNLVLDEWRAERKALKSLTENASVMDLIKSYKESIGYKKLVPTTRDSYDYYLTVWLFNRVGGVPLQWAKIANINTPMCQKVYEEHAAKSVSLANHCLSVYRLMFNYAIRHGFTQHNPFSKVLKRSDKPRKVVWTREDIKAFLDVAYGSFKWRNLGLIVQMAHEWGQRMGDMRMLRWADYNLDTGVLSMEQSKRRARISVPSSQGLQEMLRQQHEEYGWQQYIAPSNMADRMGGLLPYSQTNLARVADQVRKKAGIASELRLMDLRRTAVTEMIEAEVPLPNIMAMTGHATPQSVAPYLKHTLKGATVAARMRGFV